MAGKKQQQTNNNGTGADGPAAAANDAAATNPEVAAPTSDANNTAPIAVVSGDINAKLAVTLNKLQSIATVVKELTFVVKAIQKDAVKLQKGMGRRGATKSASSSAAAGAQNGGGAGQQADGNNNVPKLSGFAKPTQVSDELCDFLEIPRGQQLARTEVTRRLNAYIKKNELQDKDDRRIVIPNDALKKLLGVPEGIQLKYFNMQRFLKPHLGSSPPATVEAATPVAVSA